MLPQIHLVPYQDSGRMARPRHGGDGGSSSDSASVTRVSSSSGRFDDAMRSYQNSMAIRRRNTSASAITLQSIESGSAGEGEVAEMATRPSSSSLKGPQLRPNALLTRDQPSPVRLRQAAPHGKPQLPAIASLAHHPTASQAHASLEVSNASCPPVHTSVCRRSTRRPLSGLSAPVTSTRAAPPVSAAAPAFQPFSYAHHSSSNGDGGGSSRSSSSSSCHDDDGRKPSCLSSALGADDDEDEEERGLLNDGDSVLGSLHCTPRRDTSLSQAPSLSCPSAAAPISGGGSNDVNTCGQKARRGSAVSVNASTGSYDVVGLDSLLLASQEDLQPLGHHSLYVPSQSRMAAPAKAAAPPGPTPAAHRRRTSSAASNAASTSLLMTPTAAAAVAVQPSRTAGAEAYLLPSSARSGAAMPLLSNGVSLDYPLWRSPATAPAAELKRQTSAVAEARGADRAGAGVEQPFSDRGAELSKLVLDTAGRSVSPGGLSSVVNNSESRNVGSAAVALTGTTRLSGPRRDTNTTAAAEREPQQQQQDKEKTEEETAPAAAASPIRKKEQRRRSTVVESPSAEATVPADGPFAPGLSSLTDKPTAQFYHTASLAKTYNGSEFLNDYILISEIGSGATGRVVLAFSTSMNCSVAIKIILKPQRKKYRLQRTRVSSDSSLEGSSLSLQRSPSTRTPHPPPTPSPPTASQQQQQQQQQQQPRRKNTPVGAGQQGVTPNGRYGNFLTTDAAATDAGAPNKVAAADGGDTVPPSMAPAARRRTRAAASTAAGQRNSDARFTTADRMTRNLQREIDVMKDLNHPNIVRLYEVINDPKENSLYLILQYVDSGAIAQLDSSGSIAFPFLPDELLPIATQVVDGLVYLHEHSIVHRDIKPENILVNRDNQAFLADFGVAELMNAESGMPTADKLAYQGTPAFMAPEIYAMDDDDENSNEKDDDGHEDSGETSQAVRDGDAKSTGGAKTRAGSARGGRQQLPSSSSSPSSPASARVIDPYALDVWALGVTFFTLLVGHVPYKTLVQIRETVRSGVSIPSTLPEAWQTVLRSTMQPDCSQRVTSAQLQRMLHDMLAQASANGEAEQTQRKGDGADTVSRQERLRREQRTRSRSLGRQPRTAPRVSRVAASTSNNNDDDEDVILGSGTPTETPMEVLDSSYDDNSDLSDSNFSIDSSVMDVLRPSRK